MNEDLQGILESIQGLGAKVFGVAVDATEEILEDSKDTLSSIMITLSNRGQEDMANAVGEALKLNYRALEKLQGL